MIKVTAEVPNVRCRDEVPNMRCQGIPRNLARFGGFPRDLDDVTGHVTRTDQSEAEFGAGSGRKWHPKGSGTSKKTGSCANTRNSVYTTPISTPEISTFAPVKLFSVRDSILPNMRDWVGQVSQNVHFL